MLGGGLDDFKTFPTEALETARSTTICSARIVMLVSTKYRSADDFHMMV